jgi:CopG family nickel-responsive transcriptional regulator
MVGSIVAVISVSLPDPLLQQADRFLVERGFAGRSELVRAALRDFLAHEAEGQREGPRSGTLTLLYPHGYERKIGEVRHEFTDIVRSMMHGHVPGRAGDGRRGEDAASTGDLCVEVFVLEGEARRIRQFADGLRAARETRLAQLVWTDAAPGAPAVGHGHAH